MHCYAVGFQKAQVVVETAEFLFVTMDGGGNVPPLLRIAAAVSERGHHVSVLGHARLSDTVRAAGLPFEPYQTARQWDPIAEQSALRWVPMFNDADIATEVSRRCAANRPDVAVIDCMLLPAIKSVQRAGITNAVFTHTIRGYINGLHRLGAGTAARLYGHSAKRLWNSSDVNIVTTVRRLDPGARGRQPPNIEWVGPVVDGHSSRPSDPPLVLVSLSTNGFRGQRHTLERVIAALARLPVRAIVTTGGVIDPRDLPSAPNIEVIGYADHAEILPHCSLLIGHGGHATTFRALAHDVPVLFLPSSALSDQWMIALAISRAGAGRVLPRFAGPRAIRTAIDTLLADPHLHAAATRIGSEIRQSDAAARATDLLIALHR